MSVAPTRLIRSLSHRQQYRILAKQAICTVTGAALVWISHGSLMKTTALGQTPLPAPPPESTIPPSSEPPVLNQPPVQDETLFLPQYEPAPPLLFEGRPQNEAFDLYRLGPGDSIFVSVQRFPDLSFQATLDLEGNVIAPILGAVSPEG